MTSHLGPVFYALICVMTLWLALLWAGARCKVLRHGWTVKIIVGLATVLLLMVPAGGLPVWSWAFSVCPNPSLPLLGVIGVALWRQLGGAAIFQAADWRATWLFGAVTGTLLYLHPLFFGALDLYYWGWHPVTSSTGLAGLAVVFLAWGNRLGVLLLAALIAWKLELLESQNCWDYAVDPFFWLISLGMVSGRVYRRWRYRRPGDGAGPAISEA